MRSLAVRPVSYTHLDVYKGQGSAIAKSKPMKTAVTASRLGIAAYIVPFVFAFCPALIMQVPVEPYMVVLNTAMALFGLFGVASGLQGYLFGKINPIPVSYTHLDVYKRQSS